MDSKQAAVLRSGSGCPAADSQGQHLGICNSRSGANSNNNSPGGSRLSSAAGNVSNAGSLAPKKRLSMSDAGGPPPSAVAPYLTGAAVAAFVGKRATQKEQLVQYLSSHKASVCRVLKSDDSASPEAILQAQNKQPPANNTFSGSYKSDSSYAANNNTSATSNIRAHSDSNCFFSSCNPSSNGNSARASVSPTPQVTEASPTMYNTASQNAVRSGTASPSSARRASVSSYLQGKQDLMTTVTVGVPYAEGVISAQGGSYRQSMTQSPLGSSADGLVESSAQLNTLASAAVGNRHMVIKEALNARLSDAAARANLQGDSRSPRMHDEVAGIRSMLLTEGRTRRASATAVAGSNGGNSDPAQHAAAMIARRISNGAIYPTAYDGITVGPSVQSLATATANSMDLLSSCSATASGDCSRGGKAGIEPSWESAAFDEQGRPKVGYYGNYSAAGADFAVCDAQQDCNAGLGRKSSSSDGSDTSRSSSTSSDSDDSSSDHDSDCVQGLHHPARSSVAARKGGWKTASHAARVSRSSNAGGGSSRVARLSQLQKPRTTRMISKPYRSSSDAASKVPAGIPSMRRSSTRSDASKNDILELTAGRRSSMQMAGKGRSVRRSSSNSDSTTDHSRRTSSSSSSSSSTSHDSAAAKAAEAQQRRKSIQIRRKLLLRLRTARSSSSSSGRSSSSSEGDLGRFSSSQAVKPAVRTGARYGSLPSWDGVSSRYNRLSGRYNTMSVKCSNRLSCTAPVRHISTARASPGQRASISSSGGGRRLSAALEVLLNPDDKPAHRLSCSAAGAAAVVLNSGSGATDNNTSSGSSSDTEDTSVPAAVARKSRALRLRRSSSGGAARSIQRPHCAKPSEADQGSSRSGLRKSWSKVYRQAARSSITTSAARSMTVQQTRGHRGNSGSGVVRHSHAKPSVAAVAATGTHSYPAAAAGQGSTATNEASWVAGVVRRLSGVMQ